MFISFDQEINPEAVINTISVSAGGRKLPIRLATQAEIDTDGTISYYSKQAQGKRWLAFRAVNTDGSVENEVAYWRDMTLLPHLLNLLTKDRLTAHVAFGETVRGSATDRKELARRLQTAVCELAGKFDRHVTIGSHWHELPVKPV